MATRREIVQVAVSGVENHAGTQCNAYVVALCNDGTLWLRGDNGGAWERLPDIPQDPVLAVPEPRHVTVRAQVRAEVLEELASEEEAARTLAAAEAERLKPSGNQEDKDRRARLLADCDDHEARERALRDRAERERS